MSVRVSTTLITDGKEKNDGATEGTVMSTDDYCYEFRARSSQSTMS